MLNAERHAVRATTTRCRKTTPTAAGRTACPSLPPTPAKVEAFLDAAGLKAGEVLGEVPTREVVVTAEHAAINAVMAGCKQEYMPVVAAAVRAHLHEKANCHSTTGTLCGAAQVVVVNGPVRKEIEIACEGACFGPGFRANATIGRALRLVIRNVCRAIPDFLDRASFSSPLRYSFCFGENEEGSPWLPMHVERGFAARPEHGHRAFDHALRLRPSTSPRARPKPSSTPFWRRSDATACSPIASSVTDRT